MPINVWLKDLLFTRSIALSLVTTKVTNQYDGVFSGTLLIEICCLFRVVLSIARCV